MKGTILLVEDSSTQSKVYSAHLQHSGYEVLVAEDGLTALRLARRYIDAVVLDINLPQLDGFQVCTRLRRDPLTAGLPIIMLTASVTPKETWRGLEVGANDYIPKDEFAVKQLLYSLEVLLSEGYHES